MNKKELGVSRKYPDITSLILLVYCTCTLNVILSQLYKFDQPSSWKSVKID